MRPHGRQCFRNTSRCIVLSLPRASRRLSISSLPIPILTAPPSRLVWSLGVSRPSRPVTAQIRPVPYRPVSFRLASSRFASARPYRRCGRAVTLIDRYRVTKYGPRPFLLERAL